MKTIHSGNQRVWVDVGAFGTVKPWGYITKQTDGRFVITPDDRERFRKDVAEEAWEGINGKRMLAYGGWMPDGGMQNPEDCFTPYVLENGKWNLDLENPDYWPIVIEFVEMLKEWNVELIYCTFDNCQFWKLPSWACWVNNVQGLDNYMADVERAKKFVQKTVQMIGSYDNVLIEVVNEAEIYNNLEWSKSWYRVMFETLRDGGIEAERVSVGACMGRGTYLGNNMWDGSNLSLQDWLKGQAEEVWGWDASLFIYLPVHQTCNKPGMWSATGGVNDWHDAPELIFGQYYSQANYYWGGSGTARRYLLSNDGNDDKVSQAAYELWGRLCYDRMKNFTITHPSVGYKVVFELLWDEPTTKINAIRAMIDGLSNGANISKEILFPNYHKKEYTPQECQIGETKIETCFDNTTIITHTCENGKWKPTGATCPVRPTNCKCIYYLNIHDTMFGIPNFIKCVLGKKEKYCKISNNTK